MFKCLVFLSWLENQTFANWTSKYPDGEYQADLDRGIQGLIIEETIHNVCVAIRGDRGSENGSQSTRFNRIQMLNIQALTRHLFRNQMTLIPDIFV